MTGRDGVFGVFFSSDEDQIDIEEVKKNFRKYGNIAFVHQILKRVYVNFTTQEEAENCLSSSPDPKYGIVKRGKFGTEAQNSKEMNSNQNGYRRSGTYTFKKADRNEMKMHSPRESESEESRSSCRYSQDDPRRRESQIIPNSIPRSRIAERKSVPYESKYSSSDQPPPLVSANDGPPPLVSASVGQPPSQSFDNSSLLDSPPPLISALETNPPHTPRNGSRNGKGLLPTPPMYLHKNYNPELTNVPSHISNPTSVPDASDIPQLISAVSQPLKKRQEQTQSRLRYEDYVHKYGNYILIVNIPEDITVEEIEKILYPHIPVCVCEPEETNIHMKILFCLVAFSTKIEAAKAAKQLDGVEVRGQCLNMIRLDELVLFSDGPF